jgi:flagellar motor protein MotB
MRRRRWLDAWPAFADLMTVLAVVGLLTAAGLSQQAVAQPELARRLREQQARADQLAAQLAARDAEMARRERSYAANLERQRGKCREAANNERMFGAIQTAQRLVDQLSARSGLAFSPDQSLEFGNDLVTFAENSTVPTWQPDGRSRLLRFCQSLAAELGRAPGARLESQLIIEVEGHTDSLQCRQDPNCNWSISSGRAAAFVSYMRQADYCPGGQRWTVRPIGYADTKPAAPGQAPTRRIAVRLAPDYARIIASAGRSEG